MIAGANFLPLPAFAHAFLQTYSLPVPLWLFIYGGAIAVILSFIVLGLFTGKKPGERAYPKRFLFNQPLKFITSLRVLGVLTYGLMIVAGIFGKQTYLQNISVTFLWIIFLLGFTYLTIVIGNLWQYIHPLRVIVEWVGRTGVSFSGIKKYPKRLGYWPALGFYFLLVWLELLSYGSGIVPLHLAELLVLYGLLTVSGAFIFGKNKWFAYADFPSVFLRLVGRIAPIEYSKGKVYLRSPFVGLLAEKGSLSLLLFILFMLSSTAFDGLSDTRIFALASDGLAKLPLISSLSYQARSTIILALSPLLYATVYWLFIWLVSLLVKTKLSVKDLAYRFSITLVPIAIAYNVAHYYTLLFIQGQQIISLVSDPFGFGWNLLHTANYHINAGLINAATVWYSQVALIILGHIAAVYLAHGEALKIFPSPRKATVSQYPMLALMIIYTMISLWIIAQPIIR